MSAYQILMEYQHQTEALSKIAARLDWDQGNDDAVRRHFRPLTGIGRA
jgi:hypothetical protein